MDVTETSVMDDSIDQEVQPTREVPVEFSGKSGEFFGIWIVNILLSIVTLGIYSAWAKVRTQQYFYGNTAIDGHRFEYLATPMQILKGRILAIILFVCYSLAVSFFPIVGLLFIFAMLFLSPWLINQGLRFNCRMTSYRNVRFSFAGSYGEAFMCFIILPIVGAITFYIALPWALRKMDEYVYSNINYGDKPLKVKLETSQYYLASLYVVVATGIIGAIIGALVVPVMGLDFANGTFDSTNPAGTVLFVFAYLFLISVATAVFRSHIRNHLFSVSEFEGLTRFKSAVRVVRFAQLLFVNSMAIILTLGLAYPWAKIQLAAFLANATALDMHDNADDVLDSMEEQKSSFGEEASELFDVDISLT